MKRHHETTLSSKPLLLIFLWFAIFTGFSTAPAKAADIILDNNVATYSTPGNWTLTNTASAYGGSHRKASVNSPGTVQWRPFPQLTAGSTYDVYVWYVQYGSNLNVTYNVKYSAGAPAAVALNQRYNGNAWYKLGQWTFNGTNTEYVELAGVRNASADAIKFVQVVNTAPVAVPDSLTVAEGGTATSLTGGATSLLTNDTDAEGNTLTASKVSNPSHGSVTVNANGTFSYIHDGSETTSDSFTYKANDGLLDSNTTTVTITITPVNDAPVAVADSLTVLEGGTATTLVGGNTSVLTNDSDAEGSTLTASVVSNPTRGALTLNADGTFSYTHNGSETTTDSFTYRANDGTSNSNTVTVSITITPVNDAPVAVADSITVAEGATKTSLVGGATSVLTNDTDAEGNALTAIKVTNPTNGTLTLNANGSFSYAHNGSETLSDSFTYKANDGNSDSNTVTVTITITPVNDAPVAVTDTITVDEGGTATTLLGGGNNLLTNDTDAEGTALTAVKVTNPSHGTLTINANGTFTYIHDGGESSTDSFTYKAYDGTAYSNIVTVTIMIDPHNDPPVAVANTMTVAEGGTATTLTGGVTSVLANDTDEEGNTLTAIKVTDPTHGTLTLNANGTFVYTHDGSETTSDSFTYKANDGTSDSNTTTVTITITPVNDAPVAVADSLTVLEGGTATTLSGGATSVLANDTDPEGSPLTAIKVTNPTNGTVTLNANGTFSYTHNGSETLSDSFTYKARDGSLDSNVVTVSITITPANDAPVAVADTITVGNGNTIAVLTSGNSSVLTNDSDADGNTLTAVTVANVSHGTLTLNSDGTFSYTHDGTATLTDSFTYKAYDGTVYSNTVTVAITINPLGAHELSPEPLSNFTSVPLNMSNTVAPLVMIAASKDHQLYYKAYNDYADLDGDGIADTTFKPTIVYYGYFDSYKCYDYSATNKRFEPKAVAGQTYSMDGTVASFSISSGQMVLSISSLTGTSGLGPFNNWTVTNLTTGTTGTSRSSNTLASSGNKTFTTTASDWIAVGNQVRVSVTVPSYCTGSNDSYWSGNFLNWISMARIDTINKVLFGGHRRVDSATDTVLERVYLPHDAHSWAKYYAGSDIEMLTPFVAGTNYTLTDATASNNGITFCNTTDVTNTITKSEEVTDPPLIKVAKGNYSLWAGNERWQCTWDSGASADNHSASNGNVAANSGINANASSPSYTTKGIGEKNYVARVQACVSGLIGNEKCKQYPDGNYKPIGLLQAYGDDNQLKFGMVAGSYHKHVSGGTLIKNITSLNDEVNVNTNGTFAKVAVSAGGATADNQAYGIINAWSLFRIVGYNHSDGTYMGSQYDNCSWGLSSFATVSGANECKNWGNPFSEIFFQGVRYYSDAGVTGAYQDNTSVGISGLPTPQNWDNPNPLGASNYCARANIIAFNSSTSSYDNDELDANSPGVQEVWSTSVLPGNDTSAAMTDVIGVGEGINGHSYFVGETAVDNQSDGEDQLCTAKTVTSLGNVGGLCPESPRLRGSYRVAGISYYAHTQDVRSADLAGGRALTGTQTLDTYAVTNASSTPKIAIPHPLTGNAAVEILPACRNTTLNPAGNCTIVDFRIVSQVANDGTGKGTGKFYVNWEDSEQGGDYDQDMWGTISYEINGSTNTLKVTTDVHAQSTPYKMGFGYVLSGTTQDGFHVHSGINAFSFNEPATITSGGKCNTSCADTDAASTASYSLGSSTASLLQEPLWYAAKWGGFIDRNGSGTPDLNEEWDVEDTQGNPTPDGIPDNYFFAYNPQQLEDSLNRVFLKILQRTSSGTAAAVVSNNVRGEGAIYQAYYEPQKKDANGRTANWIGTLHGLWLDSSGYVREDNGDGTLGNYIDDPVIETFFDSNENRTRVKRWVSEDADTYTQGDPEIVELGDIKPLWNAREQMNFPDLNDSEIASQRSYAASAATGRFIKTWIDANSNGLVEASEYIDFADTAITNTNYPFFDLATLPEVKGLVKYLRGVETTGYRSRSVDYNGDGVTEVIRLGDIVNSTPTMVASPAESFDLLYRDSSYTDFKKQYHDRRNVLYVGANDGMLHAFNAGFFSPQTFVCTADQTTYGTIDSCNTACDPHPCQRQSEARFTINGKKADGVTDATAHPMGAELWAYVPMNLQPHLKWLKALDYTHVYFVDEKPRVFDAKIFPDDDTHPNGWGTVLVVGMRFGGGKLTVDIADGQGRNKVRRSAYTIFDVTDPESEPKLLGEIQPPDEGFTTVYPAVMTFKDTGVSDPNKWFLVFGNGPASFATGESTLNAKLYIFDLAELTTPGTTTSTPVECSGPVAINGSAMRIITCDTLLTTSFVGTPMVVDWDLDYKADALYFGTVGGTTGNKGKFLRLTTNDQESPLLWTGPTALIDVAQPVFAPATAGVDSGDPSVANHWLFLGTGRLLVDGDKSSTATQSLYGIIDNGTTVLKTALTDVTNVEVQDDGTLINGPGGQTTLNGLETSILTAQKGWKLDLPPISGVAGVAPSTRMVNQQALLGGVLFSSVYQPSLDLCASEGYSRLYGLFYKTGTAINQPTVFGTADYTDPDTLEVKPYNKRFVDLGFGLATAPAIHSGSGSGESEVSVFTQLSTGTIIRQEAETKESVRSGKKAWRER